MPKTKTIKQIAFTILQRDLFILKYIMNTDNDKQEYKL